MSAPNPSRRADATRNVVSNALSSYARDVIEAVLFLVLTPFLIRVLGVEQYGLWSLVWAAVSLFLLIDMGFGSSVVKFIADARGKEDSAAHQKAIGTFFWLYVGQMLVLFGVVAGFAVLFEQIFELPRRWVVPATTTLIVLGAGTAVGLPLAMFRGVLLGHQKQRVGNLYKVAFAIVYFTATLLLLPRYPDLRLLAALNISGTVLGYLACAIHVKLTSTDASLHPRHFDRRLVGRVFTFSVFFALIHVASLIATRVDTFVIQWALDLRAIALYALAMRVSEKATQVGVQLSRTLTPVVAELHGAHDEDRIRQVWLNGSKVSTAFAAPLLVGAALLAEPLLVSWTSAEFRDSAQVLQLLLAASMVTVIHGNSNNLLSMRNRQRPLAFAVLGGQGVNVGLSLLLVHPFGLIGVASATVVAAVAVNAGVTLGWVSKQQRTSRWFFYKRCVLPAVLPALIMSGGVVAYGRLSPITSLLEVALVEVGAIIVFWIAYWWLGFDREERGYLSGRLRSRLRRRSKAKKPDPGQEP